MKTFRPAQTGFSRVFLIEKGANPFSEPAYLWTATVGTASQSFGEAERIELPSPNQFNRFDEVGISKGAKERATITLTGRYVQDLKSKILSLPQSCPIDIHINFGICGRPTSHNYYTKKIILERAYVVSYETTEMGTLSSDTAVVDESAEISAHTILETVPIKPWYSAPVGDVTSGEILDTIYACTLSCDNCIDFGPIGMMVSMGYSSDDEIVQVIISFNGGVDWVDAGEYSSVSDNAATAVFQNRYLLIFHDTNMSYIDINNSPFFTAQSVVVGDGTREVRATASDRPDIVYAVGESGLIVQVKNFLTTTLDDGLTSEDLNDVHVFGRCIVAVGENRTLLFSRNSGASWDPPETPVPVAADASLTSVRLVSENKWFVCADNLYYTQNAGETWDKVFDSGTDGTFTVIENWGSSMLYLSQEVVKSDAVFWRSTNGGFDWIKLPAPNVSIDIVDSISVNPCDPDELIIGGQNDDSAGVLLVSRLSPALPDRFIEGPE